MTAGEQVGASTHAPVVLPAAVRAESQTLTALRLFARKPAAVGAALVLLLLILAAVFAPWLTPHDPARLAPREALKPPGPEYPFGTDHFGRDQLTRILYGGRLSLQVGLVSVSIAASIGILLGAIAGYRGGWVDELISRVLEVKQAFPGTLLALAIVAVLGPDLLNLMIAVGISAVPGFARLVRAQVLSAREYPYVLAARALGATPARVLGRHIMPNIVAPIVVYATLSIALAILAGASLNYLGMGARPPTPEWGLMLAESRDQIRRAWWLATVPGLTIMLTVIAINLVGDALRDAFDPRLRRG